MLNPPICGLFGRANSRVLPINGERLDLLTRAHLAGPEPAMAFTR